MSHIYRMTDWVTILWMTEDKMTHCLVTARKLTCKRREQSSWSQCWNFCEMSQRQPNTRLQMEVLRELPAELIFEVCRLHVGHKLFRGPEAAHLRKTWHSVSSLRQPLTCLPDAFCIQAWYLRPWSHHGAHHDWSDWIRTPPPDEAIRHQSDNNSDYRRQCRVPWLTRESQESGLPLPRNSFFFYFSSFWEPISRWKQWNCE